MKRITFIIIIVLILAILSTSAFCRPSRRDGGLSANAMAKFTTLGTYYITLIDINENLSIDLYLNRIYNSSGNSFNISQIVKNDKINNTKTVLWAELSLPAVLGLSYIPIYDVAMNYDLDKMRIIYQVGYSLNMVDVDLNENIVNRTAIPNNMPLYTARMIPTPPSGREELKTVTFLTPDLIRISSNKNAAFHLKTSDVIVDGENWINCNITWWNGSGDIFTNTNYSNSPSYYKSGSEPTYEDSSWDDWYHMKKNIIPTYANSPYYTPASEGLSYELYDKYVWDIWYNSNNVPEEIILTPDEKTIGKGNNFTIIPEIIPSSVVNKTIKWTSSDSGIATVNNSGVVTGKSLGTATITATSPDSGKTATCEVTVVSSFMDVTGITLEPASKDISVGETFEITAIVMPGGATNKNITWSSSNDSIATVNSEGDVTGVSVGSAVITATTVDGRKRATCEVTVTQQNVTVKFLKYADNPNVIYHAEDIVKGTPVSRPADPERAGFVFKNWYSNPGCTTLFDFDTAINNDTVVYPKWGAAAGKVHITWNDGISTQDASVNNLSSFTVTAGNTGTPFVYWKDARDNIRSYDSSFTFTATEDIELTAVFSNSAVTPKPIANIDTNNIIKVNSNTAGKYNVSFFGDVIVPSGCTIVEKGFIGAYSIASNPKYNNWNADNFILGAAYTTKIPIPGTSTKIQGTYNNVAGGNNYCARVYVTYTDSSGQHTVYSPEIAYYTYVDEPASTSSLSGMQKAARTVKSVETPSIDGLDKAEADAIPDPDM